MEPTESGKRIGETIIISPRASVCRTFPVVRRAMPERVR
jgi:hypothetical protein